MYLTQSLHKALRECPDREAVVFGERRLTYRELVTRVAEMAAVLRSLGLEEGERAGILALNSDRYLSFIYGVLWAGGVFNTVNIRWSAREIAYSLDDCDTRILFVDDEFASLMPDVRELSRSLQTVVYVGDGACPEGMLDCRVLLETATPVADAGRGGDQLACILYTGGTTGAPKGVMLSHANLYTCSVGSVMPACREDGVIGLHAAPFFHVAGVGLILQLGLRHGTHVIVPRFEEVSVLTAIEKESVVEIFLVPTMMRALLSHPRFAEFDLSSLRCMMYGASPIDSTLLKKAMQAWPKASFLQLYGMTELSPVVCILPAHCHSDPRYADKLMSAGRPAHMAEVRVVDSDDNEVPRGQVGEIAARGPMAMQGYWNKPEQTAEALRNDWMHTGDAGYMDEDGYVFLVDRIKDMVVSGGENVYSVEVEEALLSMPKIAQCAVIGVPDEKWGERVHAVIVLADGEPPEEGEIIAHCRTLIANYKCPRSFEFIEQMPLSGAGKILKYKLKDAHWGGQGRRIG